MKRNKEKIEPKYKLGWNKFSSNYIVGVLSSSINLIPVENNNPNDFWTSSSDAFLLIKNDEKAFLYINKNSKKNENDYYFIFCVLSVILGFELYKKIFNDRVKELAIITFAINYVVNVLGIEDIPNDYKDFFELEKEISFKNEIQVFEQIFNLNIYQKYKHLNLIKNDTFSIVIENIKIDKNSYYNNNSPKKSFVEIFTENIISQAQKTIEYSLKKEISEDEKLNQDKLSYKAKKWFVNHFPLLSALSAQFKITEDIKACKILNIDIAAVSVEHKEIFINPLAQLNEQGMRFVMAHEILHVALNHASRCQGRDKLIWNLACDFVINNWLVEMGIGIPPEGVYFDKNLKDKSADEIYLLIVQEHRLRRKMGTFKSKYAGELTKKTSDGCDMLDADIKYFAEFEDACKAALLRGVFLHDAIGRGTLPANLVEEIKAINQPPIPWQVELAKWIAERFPLEESIRTYSRPSRRQSSTPDIARPRYIRPNESKNTKTFGVVIDTSASMDKKLLAKCLGAIASYSSVQEVKEVRVIFCDAQPYDEGFVSVDILAQKIQVKGRGGTVLQPAINLLENAKDFPPDAPILVLTDGFFEDKLEIKRSHAFLVPRKAYMPYIPRGPVFEFKN